MSQVNENNNVYYNGKYWNDYPECLKEINCRLFSENIDKTKSFGGGSLWLQVMKD
jgi:hypothetical protein